ncbi:MAG: excinuclease ABC subunit UvrC [Candidatus Krumholzibacteria bacterium]|nr:excinuclease ABC subunit UvrC [Candidatus Krumholzibacteria bacterium]
MKDAKGRVIYVGKAKVLRNRVRSYFKDRDKLDTKTKMLVSVIDSIDYIATGNEVEALVLECNLIKEHRPKYNVRLKDDKKYPYLKLTVNERFPRLCLTRNVVNDGAEYFGPYTDTRAVRRTMELIRTIFPLRNCPGSAFRPNRERECLNFQIKRCAGPCTGRIDEDGYKMIVDQVRLFLRGRDRDLYRALEGRMKELSADRRFEEASVARDQLAALSRVSEKRQAVEPGGADEDVIALVSEKGKACAVVMRVRQGRVLSSESFILDDVAGNDRASLTGSFMQLYYHSNADIPDVIYSQYKPAGEKVITDWLCSKAGRRVTVKVPERGGNKRLLGLAEKNATMKLVADGGVDPSSFELPGEIKKTLGLPSTPRRIEVFDVSNIQGTDAVGSMVTFENGKPLKSGYRHFRIRDVDGIDDFAMMREIVGRRMEALLKGAGGRPDLVMVDGGIGQVNAAVQAMACRGFRDIPVIGLAKRNEEIFMAGHGDAIVLPRRSAVLRYLQRMRDEAHRFAIGYHRKLRGAKLEHSEIDEIEGIGETRKLTLLKEFGSLDALRMASVEEIAAVPGFGEKMALKVHKGLRDAR